MINDVSVVVGGCKDLQVVQPVVDVVVGVYVGLVGMAVE